MVRIAESMEQKYQAIGLRREDLPAAPPGAAQAGRPFAAHVTLGRVRSPRCREALAQRFQTLAWEPPPAFQVAALTLYQSELSPSGPRYTTLADFPLAARSSDHV